MVLGAQKDGVGGNLPTPFYKKKINHTSLKLLQTFPGHITIYTLKEIHIGSVVSKILWDIQTQLLSD